MPHYRPDVDDPTSSSWVAFSQQWQECLIHPDNPEDVGSEDKLQVFLSLQLKWQPTTTYSSIVHYCHERFVSELLFDQ